MISLLLESYVERERERAGVDVVGMTKFHKVVLFCSIVFNVKSALQIQWMAEITYS